MTIRDVIHGDIEIKDQLFIDVINTFEFQRLRNVKQLGLTFKVFPSAQHTRFSHSIGVYFLSTKVIKEFRKKDKLLSTHEEIVFKLASLLHDVGHGPLSHTSEYFFNYSHEDYSCKIIKDKNSQINKVLREYDERLVDDVCDLISKKSKNSILVSLLSSSIDIDRMDYLLRDSYFTGVVYGNIEVERLISQMVVNNGELYFSEKAKNLIEDLLFARYQMFSQVYLNVKCLVYEELVAKIFKRVSELLKEGYEFKVDISLIVPFFNGNMSVCDYIKVDDIVMFYLISQFKYEKDEILSSCSNAFIRTNPISFDKNEFDEYIEINLDSWTKNKIYNNPITLIDKENNTQLIEQHSELMNFFKEKLEIKVEERICYVRK